ncbi:UNVERIFIED_CONTAM: hypothetical protein PYX00_001152 [Menopon gallinae]|uniref:DNA replication complex GINS protein PSF3 n=1 Tax=Menopon gallinae TaxID=328185 RepID=A0AAW2ICH3_9NEOP
MCDRSYFPNYFSIEDILVTQEKVPCRTLTTYRNLGWLKPGNASEHLASDTSIDLPLWMVLVLARKPDSLKVETPKVYQEKTREIFEADARVINLFRVNQYYYEFGMYLCMLNVKEYELIQNVITQVI